MPEQMQSSFDSIPMTNEEKSIWAAIEPRRGKGSEILGTVIAERLGMNYRRVRQVISHLTNTHHKCIGSNGAGYYVAVTPDEVEEIVRSLKHRGIMIFLKAASIQKTSVHEVFGQAYLEFGDTINATR